MWNRNINEDIIIDFKIPNPLKELCELAEQANKEENDGWYWDLAETIDTFCKNYHVEGYLTKKEWDLIIRRYSL